MLISAAANFISESQFETLTLCDKSGLLSSYYFLLGKRNKNKQIVAQPRPGWWSLQPRAIFPPQASLDVLGGTGAQCGPRFDHLDLERQ